MRGASLFVLTFLVGCRGEPISDSHTYAAFDSAGVETLEILYPGFSGYSVADSAGVEILESSDPAWGDGGYRIDSVPSIQIGREEEGPYLLGSVYEALFAEDGTIVVAERGFREIRFFDSTGHHLRTMGEHGEGPGEFERITSLYRYRGDSVVAFDMGLSRTTILPTSGSDSRSIPNRFEGNYVVFGALNDGRFLLYSPGSGFHPELPPGLQWVPTDIIAVEPSNGAWRAIASLPGRQQLVEPGGITGEVIPSLYSVHAVGKHGFYWATPDRYEIWFYDAEGVLRRVMRRPVQPTAVNPSMIDEWIEAILDDVRRRQGEGAVPQYRRLYEDAAFGEYVPFFSSAFVDADERLWLSGPTWPSLAGAPRHWSVFSERGVWLGDLEAPERVSIVDSRGSLVLGIWRDEFDVPHVQVHRLIEIQ